MTKKQKKMLRAIIIAGIIYTVLFVLDKCGMLEKLPIIVAGVLFAIPYVIVGYDVVIRSCKSIAHGQVFNEYFLMMVATFAAFGTGEFSEGVAVMLFYQIGELFQSYAVGRSRASIAEMMSIAPEYANLLREDGSVQEVDPDDVHVGDEILVRAGEKVPLDGVVIQGTSFLDTAALTGESVPQKVTVGDAIISGCVNAQGVLKVRVTKEYEDSTVARILDLVENASNKKSRMENFITRFARYYTPVVTIGAVILAFLPPIILHGGLVEWIQRACIFLIVSCPCALVISVPLGFFGGIGAASRIGVLVKGSNYLEVAANLKTLVFDKTGTLTKGQFKVTKLCPAPGYTNEELLEMAAHGEGNSTHPIAQSVCEAYDGTLDMTRVCEESEVAGHGIVVLYEGKKLCLGNNRLMDAHNIVYEKNDTIGTVVYVAHDGRYVGSIVISDVLKEGAKDAINQMKQVGIKKTVMLTGDRSEVAGEVQRQLGIDEVYAQLLPADKVERVEELLKKQPANEKLGFVGDGINDAPVLMRADIGIAMGSLGSDAAIEAADIVLMDDEIQKIAAIVRIAKKTQRIVRQNVIFAIGVKILVLVLGALGYANMWEAVFADVGVAVIAILNSLRALRTK
ncbi:heavy metal translocating P-type ATPase [Eubacterium oxidoreducens]|uniref:Cd(2+)-exporting ATPase n=1 Tax=Eubacterium oxidoreducens TaxID=1732 RepID=A0A1G6AWC5_EUBOX|nr:heavy metal translocating P-type ATPase [Eubacterium oxidoreducens]SDB12697.1 Cd2+/Zn2+-exporting ATPase [Eubacterium oxidoreducens]